MNIYEILLSKCPQSHRNIHYLKRYVKFVEACKSSNPSGYTENHHIVPRGETFWPEYSSFKAYPWNKARLSGRQHYIAHWMLARALGKGMWLAFDRMSHKSDSHGRSFKITSRVFSELRAEKSKFFSELTKGRYNRTKTEKELIKDVMASLNKDEEQRTTRRWVSNGTFEFVTDFTHLPDGFTEGRVEASKQHMSMIANSSKGKVWVTNGVQDLMVFCNNIPDGYTLGRSFDVASANQGKKHSGKDNYAYGKVWVTNGSQTLYVEPCNIPEGFKQGVDDTRKIHQSKRIMGRKRYNNGVVEICIPSTEPVPEGFVKGRIRRT